MIFTMRTANEWNSLPRRAVPSPSLEIFKTQLVKALNNLIADLILNRRLLNAGYGLAQKSFSKLTS